MKYIIMLSTLILFLFSACNQKSNSENPVNATNNIESTITEKKVIVKDTIFLNITSDMTKEEFNNNLEYLANSGKSNITKYTYVKKVKHEYKDIDLYIKRIDYVMIFNDVSYHFDIIVNDNSGDWTSIDYIILSTSCKAKLIDNVINLYEKKYGVSKKKSGFELTSASIFLNEEAKYKDIFINYTWESNPKLLIKYYSTRYLLNKQKDKQIEIYYYSNQYLNKIKNAEENRVKVKEIEDAKNKLKEKSLLNDI